MDKRVVLLEIRRRKQREGRRRGEHKVNQRTTSCLISLHNFGYKIHQYRLIKESTSHITWHKIWRESGNIEKENMEEIRKNIGEENKEESALIGLLQAAVSWRIFCMI
jgi:hypothetical protein